MKRPLWWKILQIIGGVCILSVIPLIYLASPRYHLISKEIVPIYANLGIFGFGWAFGSALSTFLNGIRAKRRKIPSYFQMLGLVIGILVLSIIFFTPWHNILVFFGSTLFYFFLWQMKPEAIKPKETA
ncbi:hypothetical protein A2V71_02645 [Candidatus Berkelbacteria bacterium RBG_13_40_8]|uniref:Uncharacterized protein n=1 Tax=Candidatus Berkelbacteria bacterium RBG_13_40_8 TaxID=1797467 RepID=A0A1F5DP96_9BACT|nr:MAG: hypothetical protein A2V71_02645 [Candidatus Berkelbacteria bacterium RBG_13_40_8]